MRIGLIQMHCEKAAIEQNLGIMEVYLREAAAHSVDVVAFPEMNLTGYADPTKYSEAILTLDGAEVARLLAATKPWPMTVLAGLIEQNPMGKPYITHIVVRGGELIGYYRKITIKNEEVAWFTAGDSVLTFNVNDTCVGIAICADIANENVFAQCASRGAKIVFEVAAPGLYGDRDTRNWESGYQWWEGECYENLSRYARNHGIWILVATQAGRTLDEDFPGGGYVFAPSGERRYATTDWSPGASYIMLDLPSSTVTEIKGSS